MRQYTIHYSETYEGDFIVTLDDQSTETDAINEFTDNMDDYRVSTEVELTDSTTDVTHVDTDSEEARA